jgi:GDPmannose 4,6-dehydratase
MTRALITGIAGQDGWYLARRLRELGVEVIGTSHRGELASIDIDGAPIRVVTMPLDDAAAIERVIADVRPDELYNFAARASSAQLFDDPLATADINGVAIARMLEAIRKHSPATRFCQASSSELFVGASTSPQDETTPRAPLNAYGAAKAFADHLVAAYRASHGLFACSAILFPHESPRRGPHFLVRKVTRAAAQANRGKLEQLTLGDLSAVRDWSYAVDTVEAMRRMLQRSEPCDYVLASGEAHTVREVCELAFGHVGLDYRAHVVTDPTLVRAPEPVPRIGNPARARRDLEWAPTLTFAELIGYMVDSEP